MFTLAIIIGLYSYVIFFLGVAGLLYPKLVLLITLLFIFVTLFIIKSKIQFRRLSKIEMVLLFFLITQVFINLIGALGPELSFDALWYHLTLPKLYVESHGISFFPGGLLYYSAMPKLTEMFYTVALLFNNEILAKLIHFSFGILVLIGIYKIARKYFDRKYSLLACIVFYANLVVGWMSITAYVDLTRTFYEILAFWAFLEFIEKRGRHYFFFSAIFLGFAISTKLIAVGSMPIFIFLLLYLFIKEKKFTAAIKYCAAFAIIALSIPLPWFIFAYLHTENPIYPIFSGYPLSPNSYLLSSINFIRETWTLLIRAADPISPIYVIFLPIAILFINRLKKHEKIVALYSLLGFMIWYVTPRTGGGRFILPYLPVWSILVVIVLAKMLGWIKKYSIILIVFVAIISIGYRGFANKKYVPVILGKQTKGDFLSKNLNFKFGDFYDVDGYFARTIRPTDRVLVYGIHNLYYMDFPFIHKSYLKKGDWFNYILLGNAPPLGGLLREYSNWRLIYQNDISHVKLYAFPE